MRAARGPGARPDITGVRPVEPPAGAGDEKKAAQKEESVMFRTLLWTTVASVSLVSPLALPATASAHDRHHRHERVYRVVYRDPCRPGWIIVGTAYSHRRAEFLAEPFRCKGFVVEIR